MGSDYPPRRSGSRLSPDPGHGQTSSSVYLNSHDPRTSSTQSLKPLDAEGRRRLLLVYLHGFLGDETSFQSFPAHVHNLLSITLQESHVIHTKIYPKYRSREPIESSVENFSRWLRPHENPHTDVVLMAHSMGGLLAADVVLLPAHPTMPNQTFRHQILGAVHFDVPFLGLHPGIIPTGLGSLFKAAPAPPGQAIPLQEQALYSMPADSQDTLSSYASSTGTSASSQPQRQNTLFSRPVDSNFNPMFSNDVRLPVRKGWEGPLHFLKKHSDHLIQASTQYVTSHLQFGVSIADYPKLKKRYGRVRALEDPNEGVRASVLQSHGAPPPRIRFVNYYTASTGRPKKKKSASGEPAAAGDKDVDDAASSVQRLSLAPASTAASGSPSVSPRISVEEHRDGEVVPQPVLEPPLPEEPAVEHRGVQTSTAGTGGLEADVAAPPDSLTPSLAELPATASIPQDQAVQCSLDAVPVPPAYKDGGTQTDDIPDGEPYPNDSAAKDQGTAISDRPTSLAFSDHEAQTTPNHQHQSAHDANPHPHPTPSSRPSTSTTIPPSPTLQDPSPMSSAEQTDLVKKKKRDRKFCVLPPKDAAGARDYTWVRVYMEGVDEVSAHTGLFFLSDTYEKLVGEVADKVEAWVGEEMTRRMLLEFA